MDKQLHVSSPFGYYILGFCFTQLVYVPQSRQSPNLGNNQFVACQGQKKLIFYFIRNQVDPQMRVLKGDYHGI